MYVAQMLNDGFACDSGAFLTMKLLGIHDLEYENSGYVEVWPKRKPVLLNSYVCHDI
jgi:hypothetical protein